MDGSNTEERLAERVVREAVGMGMESPMRETIVEAVDEAEGRGSAARKVPMAGALLGLGAAFGYLLGTRSEQLMGEQGVAVDELEAPELIEEVVEEVGETTDTTTETEASDGGGSSRRLPRLALGVGLMAAGIALVRRMRSGEEEEWEPIEEFESAVESGEDEEDADEGMETESEGEESEESESEMEGDDESEMEEE